jgi:hypothetical protein
MITNWLVKFIDGTQEVVSADCIDDAFEKAHVEHKKHPRSASFHSSFVDNAVQQATDLDEFGYGYGPIGL